MEYAPEVLRSADISQRAVSRLILGISSRKVYGFSTTSQRPQYCPIKAVIRGRRHETLTLGLQQKENNPFFVRVS